MSRSVSTLALSPQHYGQPKGHFWHGTSEQQRFEPTYLSKEEVFDEYLGNKSMQQSRHVDTLKKSAGLLELHYDTMRKKQLVRAEGPCMIVGPTMGRQYSACTGYSGHIPGKLANNIVGCTFAAGSQLAREVKGQHFDPPHSGMTFTITAGKNLAGSQSLPSLHKPGSPLAKTGEMSLMGAPRRSSVDQQA